MSDFLALGGTIAIWLAISIALWLGRRLWIRARQTKRLKHAASAAELARGASAVFDVIRTPSPPDTAPADLRAYLRSETHALLNRIQQQGVYFDQVNSLRVNIQAVIGVEDHKALSDVLDLRRDLWAASEIILVEDPAQFGRTFADEGTFERFHAEAVRTLFKLPELVEAGEDVIDLRIALAIQEAEHFEAELAAAIAEARERDRLPTPAELAAYPIAWVKKIPVALAAGAAFARAFYAQASETSRRIRSSEAVTRGTDRMRQIGEDWPQRLSDGFQRATEAARENASTLRQHYDFLAAAHDFKGKYQNLIQRAPELSDRSRQFISRLELAERSERLRLTSANAAIWTLRKAVDGLAHTIALLRTLHASLRGTAPYALALAAIAPTPVRGRRIPAFRSYRRALAANRLREPVSRPVLLVADAPKAAARAESRKSAEAMKRSSRTPAKQQDERKTSRRRSAVREKVVAAKSAAKPVKTARPAASKPVKQSAAVQTEKPVTAKTPGERRRFFGIFGGSAKPVKATKGDKTQPVGIEAGVQPKQAVEPKQSLEGSAAASKRTPSNEPEVNVSAADETEVKPPRRDKTPKTEKPSAPALAKPEKREKKPELAVPNKPQAAAETISHPSKAPPAAVTEQRKDGGTSNGISLQALRQEDKSAAPVQIEANTGAVSGLDASPVNSEIEPANGNIEKRGSFLGRLFGWRKSGDKQGGVQLTERLTNLAQGQEYDEPAAIDVLVFDEPIKPTVSLLDKLSSLEQEDDLQAFDEAVETKAEAEIDAAESKVEAREEDADAEDFGPLTQSLMELQVKVKPSPPQIKAFPWLRQ
ncbi:MAG TPA: hypothetical protein VKA94_00705 [Hyphomicrobiales bacterium]|nr:hypothetical protein [Hyphomicrobiales bacterium]